VHRELDDLEPEDALESTVSGCQGEAVLLAQRRDPDLVLLYRNACLPEQVRDLAEDASCLPVGFEHTNTGCCKAVRASSASC
jgi:hypothetical protein